MKESLNKDVAEFFYEKTSGFEKTPPENIWDNISAAIPSNAEVGHFQSFINHLHLFPVLISGVAVVTIMYFIKPQIEDKKEIAKSEQLTKVPNVNETKSTKIEPIKNESLNISENKIEIKDNNKIEKIQKQAIKEEKISTNNILVSKVVPVKYDTTITNIKHIEIADEAKNEVINVKKRVYNISATNFKKIDKIIFVKNNKLQEIVKEFNQPKATQFGYYEIDITDLEAGNYRIKVLKDGVWVDHKIESFE